MAEEKELRWASDHEDEALRLVGIARFPVDRDKREAMAYVHALVAISMNLGTIADLLGRVVDEGRPIRTISS